MAEQFWNVLRESNSFGLIWLVRSSSPEVFCKKGVLRNVTKFTGKHLCQSLFLNKVAGLRPVTLLKMRVWHRCFSVNFAKFLRTLFIIEHLWWLFLTGALQNLNAQLLLSLYWYLQNLNPSWYISKKSPILYDQWHLKYLWLIFFIVTNLRGFSRIIYFLSDLHDYFFCVLFQ